MKICRKVALVGLILSLIACSRTTETTEFVYQITDQVQLLSAADASPYVFEESIETVVDTTPIKTIIKDMDSSRTGYSWILSQVQEGTHGYTDISYRSIYDSEGELLSKEEIPGSEVYTEGTPNIHQYGARATVGAYFTTRQITRYGYDCVGCGVTDDDTAGTSAGVRLSGTSVRQADGTWKEGITYEGYYIVAADKALPLCTVIEISNHNFSGEGLEPKVPFKAIVLDRGGAITTNKLDLFIGSERNMSRVTGGRNSNAKVTIVDSLRWTRNSSGERICR